MALLSQWLGMTSVFAMTSKGSTSFVVIPTKNSVTAWQRKLQLLGQSIDLMPITNYMMIFIIQIIIL